MPNLLHGCDVSDYQHPSLVDWNRLDFGIVKATDGKRPMKRVKAHVAAIRGFAKTLGLYHFLRADHPVPAQFAAFETVAKALEFGPGDLFPCLDIEDHPGFKLEHSPSEHVDRALEFACACGISFGGCILYISNRDWTRLGKPSWMLDYPLWVAHYPCKGSTSMLKEPATPDGRDWAIWQYMVGPLGKTLQDPKNSRAVDRNVARSLADLVIR